MGLTCSASRIILLTFVFLKLCQDVTPLVIEKFINRPIIEAHVLLDVKGKTLSHAFVQLSQEDARIALRSSQNAILGAGRRARAVTVTLSSQEELMIAVRRPDTHMEHTLTIETKLYPHWRGSFYEGSPSLDGLDNEQVKEALEHGLLSEVQLKSLLNLITIPNVGVCLCYFPSMLMFSAVTLLEGDFVAILLTYQHSVYVSVGR